MTCVAYAQKKWKELTGSDNLPAAGRNGPTMYESCAASRKQASLSTTKVPCIVVFTNKTGSGDGHVGVIESYDSVTKKYTYSDANYDANQSGTIRKPAIQVTDCTKIFNSLVYKGIMF